MTDAQPRRIICKLGTNLLTSGSDRLDPAVLDEVVRQVAELRTDGAQVAVVTSGAVTAGRARVGVTKTRSSVGARQALAAIGQAQLVQRYDSLLQRYGLTAAQALITRGDVTERRGYLNVRNTLLRLLQYGVVPIINENDVVADEELRGGAFGENDALSALIANLIDADLLILLSDVDGVYDRDPRTNEDATLIEVLRNPASMMQAAGNVDERSRGGMRAKLEAARRASAGGAEVVIASGTNQRHQPHRRWRTPRHPRPADTTIRDSRDAGSRRTPQRRGTRLDQGAVTALTRQGRSLLPAGIINVRGQFERGDVIQLYDANDIPVAVGISNYSSSETSRIQGKKSSEIATELGYNYGSAVVHRNNLALLPKPTNPHPRTTPPSCPLPSTVMPAPPLRPFRARRGNLDTLRTNHHPPTPSPRAPTRGQITAPHQQHNVPLTSADPSVSPPDRHSPLAAGISQWSAPTTIPPRCRFPAPPRVVPAKAGTHTLTNPLCQL